MPGQKASDFGDDYAKQHARGQDISHLQRRQLVAAYVDRHHRQRAEETGQKQKRTGAERDELQRVGPIHLEIGNGMPQPRGHQPDDQCVETGVVNVIPLDPMTPRLPR